MDFSQTTLIVATSGTLASSGSTDALTAGQVGVFGPDYVIATSGDIAADPYFYIAQGRKEKVPGLGSKRTDKISKAGVIEWYKVTAESDVTPEVFNLTTWKPKCDDDIHVTLVLHSNYIDNAFFNGLTRTVTVKAPCCNCGDNPCADLQASDIQNIVDQVAAKINETSPSVLTGTDVRLSRFVVAERLGSGASSYLKLTGKTLDVYGNECDVAAFPYEYDRLWFRAFAYKGLPVTSDYFAYDRCEQLAVGAVAQRALYPKGTSAEIRKLEKDYYSYQTSHFKHLHRQVGYNGAFETYVSDGTYYDTYYIKFRPYGGQDQANWTPVPVLDARVIVAIPTGQASAFETVLNAALGTVSDKSGANITTTTTTSTSSTTTTSTTAPFIP